MPADVPISVEGLTDHRADEVWIAIQNDISARSVECHGKSTWRSGVKIDRLGPHRITVCVTGWADAVELQIGCLWVRPSRTLIYEVIVLYIDVALEIYLNVYGWIHSDPGRATRDVACDMNRHVSVCPSGCGINGQRTIK